MKDEPFKERFRHIAPSLVDEVCQHIQEMLDGSAIWPSQSPWCNAMVLVRKKDGSLWFCIDFRRLNAWTKKDAYPLHHMQETMESMVGTRHFSCMDLKSGFWQAKMDEESRQYTAFTVGSMGVYEFLHMPYSLCNAPATFQHLMQNCLGELNLTYALIYLDDMIIYSKTEEEHLVRLCAILEQFMENGLKLKPSKCNFFHTEINYLGHKVSVAGMEPGTKGLKGIVEIAPPATYTQVRKFLGARTEMTGGDRWVLPVLGTPGQGLHTKPAHREVLVARHGPKNDDECPQLSKVLYFRSQTLDIPIGAHPLHRAVGPGTHWLCVHGSNGGHKEETRCEKCLGHRRPLHMLHPGICHQQSHCAHYGTHPLQQLFLGVWVP